MHHMVNKEKQTSAVPPEGSTEAGSQVQPDHNPPGHICGIGYSLMLQEAVDHVWKCLSVEIFECEKKSKKKKKMQKEACV